MRNKSRHVFLVAAALALPAAGGNDAHATSTLSRSDAPVVITGAQAGSLAGVNPGDVVAFRWNAGWEQIPVQVDERHVTNIRNAYPTPMVTPCGDPCYNPGNRRVDQLVYSDAKTLIGADPDTTLDANDEIAFMVKDTGAEPPAGAGTPAGVVGNGVTITATDPLDQGTGTVVLFERDSSASQPLDPAAGRSYVEYHWEVTHIGDAAQTAAEYATKYRFNGHNGTSYVGNPENSWVETAHYRREMTGRWHDNVLIVKRDVANPVNILHRHDASISLDQTGIRNQNTFDVGEMAYITSKGGPIRAIRDYLGTNSGPLTQRRHIFYESTEVIRIDLRVHAIPGASDVWNYNANAVGLRTSTFVGSDRIDGAPGPYAGALAVLPGSWSWETIDRDTPADPAVGGLTYTIQYDSNNVPSLAHHIVRDGGNGGSPSAPYRGASINQGPAVLGDTDANASGPNNRYLWLVRNIHYEATGTANGPARLAEDTNPLTITTTDR